MALPSGCGTIFDDQRQEGSSCLSGGLDSASTLTLVFSFCRLLFEEIGLGNLTVLEKIRQVANNPELSPNSPQDIMKEIMVTCYMGTKNSSETTKVRAAKLAEEMGTLHYEVNIDSMFDATISTLKQVHSTSPAFEAHGGSPLEDLAL